MAQVSRLFFVVLVLFVAMPIAVSGAVITRSFEDGECGTPGAEWRFYDRDGGVVEVGEGFIRWTGGISPWAVARPPASRIVFTGPVTAGDYLTGLFAGLHATEIEGLHHINTENVTNMRQMAMSARIHELDLSGWDTSNVTDMSLMFGNSRDLTSINLSGWDTSNVTQMGSMFTRTDSLRRLVLGENFRFTGQRLNFGLHIERPDFTYTAKWLNVGAGTEDNPEGSYAFRITDFVNFYRTPGFADTWVLRFVTCSDCGEYSCVCICEHCLAACGRIEHGFFEDGGGIPGAPWLLHGCGVLEIGEGFLHWDNPRSPWNDFHEHDFRNHVSSVIFTGPVTAGTSLRRLFLGMNRITEIEGLQYINTENVTNMSLMFQGIPNLKSLDLSGWDTRNVTIMNQMFADADNLRSLDLSGWDTRNVTDMRFLFDRALNLRKLTLGENFHIPGSVVPLPGVPSNDTFTGRWQNVGQGTWYNPQGSHVYTSAQLVDLYRTAPPNLADTWVWQRHYPSTCPYCGVYPCGNCDHFGPVPPTGIANITRAMYAMLALAGLSAVLWLLLLRRHNKREVF